MSKEKLKPKNFWSTIIKIIKIAKDYKFQIIVAFVILVIAKLTIIFSMLNIQGAINELSKFNKTAFLEKLYLLVGLAILGIVLNAFGSALMATMSQKAIYDFRNKLFTHLQKMKIKYFDNTNSGELISRFVNDVELISLALDQSIIKILMTVIMTIFTVISLFYLNYILATIVMIVTIVFSISIVILGKHAKKYNDLRLKKLGVISGFTEENLSAFTTIKGYNLEDLKLKKFENKSRLMQEYSTKESIFSNMINEISISFDYILIAIVATIGGMLMNQKMLEIGTLVAFLNLARTLSQNLTDISGQFKSIIKSVVAADRAFEIMEEEEEEEILDVQLIMENGKKYWKVDDKKIEAKGFIEFENVDFSYEGTENLVLKNISLYAKPNQKIAFVGATGARKNYNCKFSK